MMNVLALSLVVFSLAAGVWSPAPQRDDVIVKEGHRVVVVEYDEDGEHNTKVSISSPSTQQQMEPGEYFGKGSESALPNYGHGISQGKDGATPGELVCDAFGKCTQKYVKAFDKVAETAHEAKDKVSETAQDVGGKVAETAHGTKDKVAETAHGAKDKVVEKAHQTKGAVGDALGKTKGVVGDALGKAKGAAAQKGQDVKESARESILKAKDTVKTAKDMAETVGEHVMSNVSDGVENVQGKVRGGANKLVDGFNYMTSMEALNRLMGMANLLGLATAYGMSVWVTFISSYVLAKHLPRQQFGVLQSKIYPVYFRAMTYSIMLALLGHFLWHRKKSITSLPEIFQSFSLLSSLLMVLFNALYLEPRATKVMFERMKMEKEEGRGRPDFVAEGSRSTTEPPSVGDPADKRSRTGTGPSPATEPASIGSEEEVIRSRMSRLNEKLKKLNTNSSLLNVLTLMSLTWHLVYLGQRMTMKC